MLLSKCVLPENIHTPPPPTEGIGNSWGLGVPKDQKFKEMYEVELKFPEGRGNLIKKIPSVGEVWIFFGTTQSLSRSALYSFQHITDHILGDPGADSWGEMK